MTTPELIDKVGASYTRTQVAVKKIDIDRSTSNQVRTQPLNSEVIDDYAAAMKRGDKFPPILVANNNGVLWLLGGNHRHAAALKSTITKLDAFVIHEPTEQQATLLAFGDNATHGQPLTNAERLAHAVWLMANTGLTKAQAAAHVGVSNNRLHRHIELQRTRERCARLLPDDSPLYGQISPVAMTRLGNIKDDTVFTEMVIASSTYAIPAQIIYTIVTDINSIDDPQVQLSTARQYIDDFAAVGVRDRSAGRTKRTELHRISDALLELGSVDFDSAASDVKPGDEPVWDRRLKEAAQRLFGLRNRIIQ